MDHGGGGGGMEGLMMMPPSPASTPADSNSMMNDQHPHHKMMMMHMTFFWGKDVEILFDGWPGRSIGMYLLSLLLVFLIALLVEWLSFSRTIKPSTPRFLKAVLETVLYGLRIGLGYLVMLSVMSFNGGVLLVAVAGHALGFLLFGSSLLMRPNENQDDQDGATRSSRTDLPARKC